MKVIFFCLFILSVVLVAYGKGTVTTTKSKSDDSLIIPSNGETDSINISQIVAAQIKKAHDKMLTEQSKPQTVAPHPEKIKSEQAITHSLITLPSIINTLSSTKMKISMLAFASFFAALVVIVRRKRFSRIFKSRQALKNNIKLLREERIFVKHNSKLSDVRNKLKNNPTLYSNSKERFSQVAKDLNISQGEILLAAKIKAHELGKAWLTK